ncbi:ComF family protein [Xanthomonas graminis]|uniref:ComF family protein n=1 Tax=Xanthomonas graminis TaxID=3390026 RepID=UPI001F3B2F25|nr:ComF family protein [Xanthomonas translucens]UKE73732.1 ComF family protein [Xanthomonas translucens pv. phleipratensis]
MDIPVNFNGSGRVDGCWRWLQRWVLPERCLVCSEPGAAGLDLCPACRDALPCNASACQTCALPLPALDAAQLCGSCQRTPPPLALVASACVYAAPVDGLLRRFKFHQDLAAGRVLAAVLQARCAGLPRPQALLPVPLHRARLRQRGYDQALELARPLARALGLPLCAGLQRVRATAPQSELDARARRRNLRHAFAVQAPLPAHVALIDDVMTTGATLHAAAQALRRAGVARVDAWVVARVP